MILTENHKLNANYFTLNVCISVLMCELWSETDLTTGVPTYMYLKWFYFWTWAFLATEKNWCMCDSVVSVFHVWMSDNMICNLSIVLF